MCETLAKRSILFKVKEGEDFNRRNTLSILSPPQADESDAEIGQKRIFCKGLVVGIIQCQ